MTVLAMYVFTTKGGMAYVELADYLLDDFLDWVIDGDAPAYKFSNQVIVRHDMLSHFIQVT